MPIWKSNGHLTLTRVKIKLSFHFLEPSPFLHFLISLDSYSILPIVQGKNHELILFFFFLNQEKEGFIITCSKENIGDVSQSSIVSLGIILFFFFPSAVY